MSDHYFELVEKTNSFGLVCETTIFPITGIELLEKLIAEIQAKFDDYLLYLDQKTDVALDEVHDALVEAAEVFRDYIDQAGPPPGDDPPSHVIYGTGGDQTAEIAARINDGATYLEGHPGDILRFRSNTDGTSAVRAISPNLRWNLNCATLRQEWNPANPATLGNGIEAVGGERFEIYNGFYEVSPKAYAQGYFYGSTGTDYDVAIDPAYEPAWTTMNNVRRMRRRGDGTIAALDGQYLPNDVGDPQDYSIVATTTIDDRGWRVFRCTPPVKVLTPQTVDSWNPFIVNFPGAPALGGQGGPAAGFTGVLGTILNGQQIEVVPLSSTQAAFYINGGAIDASAAQSAGFTPGGTVTTPAIPTWMAAAVTAKDIAIVCVDKRAGQPFFVRETKNQRFAFQIKNAAAAGILSYNADVVDLDMLFRGDPGDLWCCNAGPVQILNAARLTGAGIDAYGCGDDILNTRGGSWNRVATGYGANWIDVPFVGSTARGPGPRYPAPGNLIEFTVPQTQADTVLTIKQLAASPATSGATRVTFTANLPGGFALGDAWQVFNRSAIAMVDLDHVRGFGHCARLFLPQSANSRVRDIVSRGGAGSGIRRLSPASLAHPNVGGGKGGHVYQLFDSEGGGRNSGRYNAAVLYLKAGDGLQPSGFAPDTLQSCRIVDYGFGAIDISGVDLTILSHEIHTGGVLRTAAGVDATQNGFYDYCAEMAVLTFIDRPSWRQVPTFRELAGGFVHWAAGSMFETSGDATAGQSVLTAYKKVRHTRHITVLINGIIIPQTAYSVNSTTAVTLVGFTLNASDTWRIIHSAS